MQFLREIELIAQVQVLLQRGQRVERLRERMKTAVFYIYLVMVNLTWVGGSSSCNPPRDSWE
jgi:hypothetical protein